jgi:hypothetical protein
VDQQGDLLVAKAKMLPPLEMERTLVRIGALISFTRQLDVRMVDDTAAERAFSRFLALVTADGKAMTAEGLADGEG